MSRVRTTCLAMLAIAIAPCRLAGQQKTAMPGEWVRVTQRESHPWGHYREGVLIRASEDTLYLDPDGPEEQVAVPLWDFEKLERYAGRRGHSRTGAIIGGAAGLVIGVAIMFPTSDASCEGEVDCPVEEGVPYAPLATVPMFGGIGALVGLAFRSDHWERVGLPPVSLVPLLTPDQFGVAVRIGSQRRHE